MRFKWFILSASLLAIVLVIGTQKREVLNEQKLCEAIRIGEGTTSRYPYGIKSVPCYSQGECKAMCLKTLGHYERDFARHGGRGIKNFIIFASRRYVGSNDRIGQKNWVKNVTYWYYKQGV